MGAVLELVMRRIIAAAVILGLTGCAQVNAVTQAILDPDATPEMNIPTVNRAAIEQADLAAVLVLSPSTGIVDVAAAIQARDDLILYSSNENRGVSMNGGLISASLGFGTNLQAVTAGPDDPLATNAIPSAWPNRTSRTYFLSQRGPDYQEISTSCSVVVGSASVIEVVGVSRQTIEIAENCATTEGNTFQNMHYVDPQSGKVWRTLQWTGPVQGSLQLDVIEQFE